MCNVTVLTVSIGLLFLLSLRSVLGATYLCMPDDDEVFSNCEGQPNGMQSLLDLSNFTFVRTNEDKIRAEGDAIVIWNVEPTDRISGQVNTYRFERGAWQPTIFNGVSNDLCKEFYAKGNIWHDFWTKNIINKEYCVNSKGAILKHAPFNVEFKVSGIQSLTLAGRYKIVIHLKAIDKMHVARQTEICIEIIAEAIRIQ